MKRLTTIILLLFHLPGLAQVEDSIKKSWSISGYFKDLQSVSFGNRFNNISHTHLVHNRLNLKWKPGSTFSAGTEIRNRFYQGSDVKNTPNFGRRLRNENEAVNLSVIWHQNRTNVLHTNVERLWLEYRQPSWNLRAGRQRINWGMTVTWNPNDIFNTYNFLDFDYEERSGSDALRGQYSISDNSGIEAAVALSGEKNEAIAAIKYAINHKGYDLQFISGLFHQHFTAGAGWAGSIDDIGYKGEVQIFTANKDTGGSFNLTMELDYVFKKGWYVNGGMLYNHNGLSHPEQDWSHTSFKISPLNLMPARWNILAGTSKEFSPLFNGSLTVVYSPAVNMLILFPSFRYNLFPNIDIDFVWQSFFAQVQHKFQSISNTVFLRAKWSF